MTETGSESSRTWATFCHLAAFAGFIFPFGNIIGPLIIWLLKKDYLPLVDEHGKEAVNFQISMSIYILLALPLVLILIGIVILPILAVLDIIFTIMASVAANKGEMYRYPLAIRFIK